MIRLRMVAGAVLLAGTIAACGSSSSGGTSPTGTTGTPSATSGNSVTIKGFAFHPASLTVKVGDKVTFTNEDSVVHTATGSGNAINSGNLAKGQSYTVTFTKVGTYNYICSIHPYMKGTVIVQ
jgi:plastocyanin